MCICPPVYRLKMTDSDALIDKAAQFAKRAVQCDKEGLIDSAALYYMVRIYSPQAYQGTQLRFHSLWTITLNGIQTCSKKTTAN